MLAIQIKVNNSTRQLASKNASKWGKSEGRGYKELEGHREEQNQGRFAGNRTSNSDLEK